MYQLLLNQQPLSKWHINLLFAQQQPQIGSLYITEPVYDWK